MAQRDSEETLSDANGCFALARPPRADLVSGSVLVVTHPRFWAGGQDLAPDASRRSEDLEIVLEPSSPISVRVLDMEGVPQPGALVHHLTRPREARSGESVPLFERFLADSVLTDAEGRAELAPFRGEQAFWAQKEALVSTPWEGPRPAEVVLRLGASFTVGGSVTLEGWSSWDPDYHGERRITVFALEGSLWRPLARLRGVQEGNWGPLCVPVSASGRYRVRLEGAPIVPEEVVLERPRVGTHQRVDFVGRRQTEIWFFVTDGEERPVTNATAVVRWGAKDAAGQHVVGASRPDGLLYCGGLPAGPVEFLITAPGLGQHEGYIEVPLDATIPVTLEGGGRILGRCMHAGVPVADFEVVYWRQLANLRLQHRSFLGRTDGSFELEHLGAGTWSLYATSASLPSGPPSVAAVQVGEDTRVELTLATPLPGGGRVLDADSGEPLTKARIQVHCSGGVLRSLPWGAPFPVSSDGSFERDAFVRGANYITVECPDHASAEVQANLADEEFLDWGDIRLFRPQTLRIRLLGIEQLGFAPSELAAFANGTPSLPRKHFNPGGEVVFEDVAPGDYRVILERPDRSFARLQLRLDPGQDWTFDHKVAGAGRVRVRVRNERGEKPAFEPQVVLADQEEDGVYAIRQVWEQDDAFLFEGLRASRAQVLVFGPDGKDLASREVALVEDPLEVEIRLGEAPLRVHVLDEDGSPIAGASVRVRSADGAEVRDVDETDGEGWAELFGVPRASLLMDVSHGLHGACVGVHLDGSQRELEFVLAARGSLELHLADGELPLAGVLARIETTGGVTLGDARQTDEKGAVRFGPLGAGTLRVGCQRADCWPALVEVALGRDENVTLRVPMRRLADLELTLRNAKGLPVSGVELELHSLEFQESLATWLAEERIRPPGGLRTDALGKLRVEGVPHGEYSWSVPGTASESSGSFVLAPGKNSVAAVLAE